MSPARQGVYDSRTKRQSEDAEHNEEKTPTREKFTLARRHLEGMATYFPLIAAILAPLATLLDIPALCQHWYSQYGVARPDPSACLALSAVSLVFNIFGNVLLIIRFSSKHPFWIHHATRWSLLMWIAKTGVAAANLIFFGIISRNGDGWTFAEGFWCAVVSIIDSGIITLALLFHYFLAFDKDNEDNKAVRTEGRRFMLSVTFFIAILAIQSLVFCKIESWAYADSIYFSVQTALTIGYGDFTPTTTAGKVLIFPFSVLTISQLGNEIALIISFISARSAERRERWKRRYEAAMHQEANALRPKASLLEEMALIHQINSREEMMSQMYDLLWSAVSLIAFWVVGSALFSQIEGWSYGNAVYAVMILSLTIGFGDFTPVHPAGRVVFIVYALMAVPIVTSFAVQTITGLLSTYSSRGAMEEKFMSDRERTPEAFAPHSDYVLYARESYGDKRTKALGDDIETSPRQSDSKGVCGDGVQEGRRTKEDDVDADPAEADKEEDGSEEEDNAIKSSNGNRKVRSDSRDESVRSDRRSKDVSTRSKEMGDMDDGKEEIKDDVDRVNKTVNRDRMTEDGNDRESGNSDDDKKLEADLLKHLMSRIIQLEAEARQMLLDSMDDRIARTLLLADRNVQIRDVKLMRGDDANMLAIWRGEEDKTAKDQKAQKDRQGLNTSPAEANDVDMIARVMRYRNTFAEVLVIGSILQNLDGDERYKFERTRDEDAQDEKRTVAHETSEKVADEKSGGRTRRLIRHHAKRLRTMDFRTDEQKGESMV